MVNVSLTVMYPLKNTGSSLPHIVSLEEYRAKSI